MKTRTWVGLLILAVIALGCALAVRRMLARGFSAREEPTAIEELVARRLRRLAVPRAAREMKNPAPLDEAALSEARAHFADHCAICHGNDGRGQTPIGRNLYPKAPNMTLLRTQSMSDGEIFSIIKNGVRLTGMPAWGKDTPEDDMESWKLVHFIRHLPAITPQELEEMKKSNPVSRRELEEEAETREFLEGGEGDARPTHKH